MPRPRNIALLLLLLGFLGLAGTWYRNSEATYFKTALVQIGIPAQGSLHQLRIAYAQAMARNNPLVALPGVDPNALLSKLEGLRALRDELVALQATPQEQAWVHDLYPIEFLTAAAELERARLTFITSGTETNEERYEQAQRIAIKAYYRDVKDFRNAYRRAVPEDVGAYATPMHIIDRGSTLAALDTLSRGMQVTALTAATRSACVHGYFFRCEKSDTSTPTSPGVVTISTDGQYVLPNAACIKNSDSRVPTFAIDSGAVSLTSDAVLIYIDKDSPNATLPFARYFLKHGTAYIPVHPLLYYQCPESDADVGALLAAATGSPSEVALENWTHSLGLVAAIDDIVRAERSNIRLTKKDIDMGLTAKNLFFARSAMPALFLAHNPSATGVHGPLYRANTLTKSEQPYVWYSDGGISAAQLAQSLAVFKQLYASH